MASHPPLLRARNALADGFQRDAAELANHLWNGVLTVLSWAQAFGSMIVHGITSGFSLGKYPQAVLSGKHPILTESEHAIVSDLIATQYGFAGPFAQAVEDAITAGTPLSEDAIASRSGLYAGGSIIRPFEVGRSDAFGIDLPYYPTDDSPCQGNCRCSWSITDDGTIITATWIAQDDFKVCDVCQERADAAPFEFPIAA